MWTAREVLDPEERRQICTGIIDALPNWFGLPDANTSYIEGVGSKAAFVVSDGSGTALGMLSLAHPYPTNADIYWLGVLPAFHRKGIGKLLLDAALAWARELGCETTTVETLSDTDPDPGYGRTRAFYKAMGFKPLFELRPHGDNNPLVYMMKQL
jgi:GNAT superfamily N-acetyltransferase